MVATITFNFDEKVWNKFAGKAKENGQTITHTINEEIKKLLIQGFDDFINYAKNLEISKVKRLTGVNVSNKLLESIDIELIKLRTQHPEYRQKLTRQALMSFIVNKYLINN